MLPRHSLFLKSNQSEKRTRKHTAHFFKGGTFFKGGCQWRNKTFKGLRFVISFSTDFHTFHQRLGHRRTPSTVSLQRVHLTVRLESPLMPAGRSRLFKWLHLLLLCCAKVCRPLLPTLIEDQQVEKCRIFNTWTSLYFQWHVIVKGGCAADTVLTQVVLQRRALSVVFFNWTSGTEHLRVQCFMQTPSLPKFCWTRLWLLTTAVFYSVTPVCFLNAVVRSGVSLPHRCQAAGRNGSCHGVNNTVSVGWVFVRVDDLCRLFILYLKSSTFVPWPTVQWAVVRTQQASGVSKPPIASLFGGGFLATAQVFLEFWKKLTELLWEKN